MAVVVAEGGGEVLEEMAGGRCSREKRREGIVSRVPLMLIVEVEVEAPVASAVPEEMRREPNVDGTVIDAAASSAAAAVLDKPPLDSRPPTPSLAPLLSPPPPPAAPPSSRFLPPPLSIVSSAAALSVAAAVVAGVLPDNLVEGSPGEEEGAESLALNGCWADLWNSERRDLSWVTFL